jgi:DNA mismatch repair protein MutS
MSTFDEYFEQLKAAIAKYGNRTVLMMQIGAFYEMYGSDTVPNSEDIIADVAKILDMNIGKKQKPEKLHLIFCGFPKNSYEEQRHNLLQANYTIIRIDQDGDGKSNGGKKVPRFIGTVESPGTYMESTGLTNILLVIYIKYYESNKMKSISIGASSIDLRTGACNVYETSSTPTNYYYPFEDIYRFICSCQPVEIRIYSDIADDLKKYTTRYLELDKYKTIWQLVIKDTTNSTFQNEFIQKIYAHDETVNSIDLLGLTLYKNSVIAFVNLLKYVYEYHSTSLKGISAPKIDSNQYMVLANNAVKQLRLIPQPGETGVCSLFNVMDKTKTIMGRRLLKYRILHPFIKVEDIQLRHTYIDEIRPISEEIDSCLRYIMDLETCYRKIILKKITPSDFAARIYIGHVKVHDLLKILSKTKYPIEGFDNKSFGKVVSDYLECFEIKKMASNGEESFLVTGHNEKIDKLQEENVACDAVFEDYMKKMTKHIKSKDSKVLIKGESAIRVDYNENDKYHLCTTNIRAKCLKDYEGIKMKTIKSRTKITNDELDEVSAKKHQLIGKLKPLIMEDFYKIIIKWYTKHESILEKVNNFISELDVANSMCKIAVKYKYIKPKIIENESGYIKATELRNPFIERIIDTEFVSNDVDLKESGVLLYGPNMAGKSTYMRGVGLSVIMAQMGSYVPATKFKFSPYYMLITRIMGEDDERKGSSSFMVEMSEMRIMVKCANQRTLALGDEICRGTGHYDAISLVSATIQHMAKQKSSFIFTTHLHDLNYRDEITKLKNVEFQHLSVDSITEDEATYNRKIQKGSGKSNYGIEIAKSLGMGEDFITEALRVRNELEDTSLISNKKSRYNSKVRMTECEECGSRKDLQTDHVIEQAEADSEGFVDHRHKNHKSNLMVLCKKCHAKKTIEYNRNRSNST